MHRKKVLIAKRSLNGLCELILVCPFFMEEMIRIKPIEIAHLNLRYSHIRVQDPRAVIRMADSIERYGQIMPILVVTVAAPRYTLIDGYLRVAAAKRSGKDTLLSHVWNGSEKNALCHVLVKDGERKWDIFEQAGLIQELHRRHGLSQRNIAHLLGKNPSWVSRRLSILASLPDKVAKSVQRGNISSWAATRVLTPMARANAEHAGRLTENLIQHPLSTRQLFIFFKHYQRSNRKVRENMVNDPQLFVKAEETGKDHRQGRLLKAGPEGKFREDLRIIGHMTDRLIVTADTVFYAGQSNLDRRGLMTAFRETDQMWRKLNQHIERRVDDIRSEQRNDFSPVQGSNRHPSDQPADEHLP
ncbi:MAG: ParB/RepB/Spo0J family partition protein [Desulfobacterales bacterium]|nr:ParB/RepB/Spo0J family partition protein [Desulfobacterales bacterium]MDP6682656.1 ParB/RepB/Spo0J family partition protein [Desulfobacterales bacterium]